MFDMNLTWDRPARTGSLPGTHTLRVRLIPSTGGGSPMPMHLAVALDTSGSMEGTKLEKAKEACITVAGLVRPEDRFSLAGFSFELRPLVRSSAGGDDCAAYVRNAISSLQAEGTTRVEHALEWIESTLAPIDGEMTKAGILITDGHPTDPKGDVLKDTTDLLTMTDRLSAPGIRVTAVGLGDARNFNVPFLADLAARGKGSFIYSESPDELANRLKEQLNVAQSIVLDNVTITAKPLSDGVNIQRCCRISPEYVPLDMKNDGDARIVSTGMLGAGAPTDILFMIEVPPIGFGVRESSRPVVEIKCETADADAVKTETAEIADTLSYSRAQQFDPEVDRARIRWDINMHSEDMMRCGDPARNTGLLENILHKAHKIGEQSIEDQASGQLENLKKTGRLDDRKTALLIDISRNTGRLP